MWDFLKFLIKRIVIKDFSMWLLFLLIFWVFMPSEIKAFLNPKTPAFFPDWFTMSDFAAIVFFIAHVCYLAIFA